MKRIKFLTCFVVLSLCSFNRTNVPEETYQLYGAVINLLAASSSYSYAVVADSTTVHQLQNVDFRQLRGRTLNPAIQRLVDAPDWSAFLTAIQTKNVRNGRLADMFATKTKVRLLSKAGPMYKRDGSGGATNRRRKFRTVLGPLFLSPVIFSADHSKAIFSVYQYHGPENSAATLYLFDRKEDTSWRLYTSILLSIS
ncbi:hypothetical protein A6C57_02485 [Fibrella sp. ES10-3-2-2]|nr:hypothetical protein A6C57_02485 [Fibrella sp. ES10-3-2-2]